MNYYLIIIIIIKNRYNIITSNGGVMCVQLRSLQHQANEAH